MIVRFAAIALLLVATSADGRSREQVRLFRGAHPCPATQKTAGACVGYRVDHIVPLCASGADAPDNMQWQGLKDSLRKDRVEIAYCAWLRKAGK